MDMTSDLFDSKLLEARKKLTDLGMNPYPYSYSRSHDVGEIRTDSDKHIGHEVTIAGRILSIRLHGKSCFADVSDSTGRIQLYVRRGTIDDLGWEVFSLLDIGDIVGAKGQVFITKMGELTIQVERLDVLSKTAVRVPIGKSTGEQAWFQLSDPEVKYRERYLDWIVNDGAREPMLLRARIISEIRKFMEERGFLEVTVPTIEMVYGGAEARPFETAIWALDGQKAFLRISPELPLKRFIVGGFPKVYSICQNFRNEGIDRSHNPEFTMMEWYEAYTDYEYQMRQFEELVAHLAIKVRGAPKLTYQNQIIDFSPPWRRLPMLTAVRETTGLDPKRASDDDLLGFCQSNGIISCEPYNRGLVIAEIFDRTCSDMLIQPTFVMDHPKETSPLCKVKRGNPELIERFEPYVCGMEIGNAYSELTDPVEQYEHFSEQQKLREKEEIRHHPIDMDFVKAVGCGMPPTGGVGFGVDRVIMLLTDAASIRDIIAFPLMKPKQGEAR